VLQGGGLDADTRTWDDEEERRARIDLVAEMDAAAVGPLQADPSPEIKRELFKAAPPPHRPAIGPARPDAFRDDGDDTNLDDIDDDDDAVRPIGAPSELLASRTFKEGSTPLPPKLRKALTVLDKIVREVLTLTLTLHQ